MIVPRTVAQVLKDHVTLKVERIDRMYRRSRLRKTPFSY